MTKVQDRSSVERTWQKAHFWKWSPRSEQAGCPETSWCPTANLWPGFYLFIFNLLSWKRTSTWNRTEWKQNFDLAGGNVEVVQLPSHVRLFSTPWTTACQASLSLSISWSLPKFMSSESMMPSNQLILCLPLLLLPSIFPSIRVFFNESAVRIMWPKNWSFC